MASASDNALAFAYRSTIDHWKVQGAMVRRSVKSVAKCRHVMEMAKDGYHGQRGPTVTNLANNIASVIVQFVIRWECYVLEPTRNRVFVTILKRLVRTVVLSQPASKGSSMGLLNSFLCF